MSDEYFDIIDEDNILTGEKRLRTEAHRDGLWHRTVHIYLFREINGEIEILVHLRSKDKDLHPNEWDTRFGGHVKAGETLEATVEGELREEIGLQVEPAHLIKGEIYKHDGGTNREFNAVYYYRFAGDEGSLKFNDGEIQKVQWMKKDQIEHALHTEPSRWVGSLAGFEQIIKILTTRLGWIK